MSKRANKRIRQLERRLAVLEKQQTTGCACRSKQEVTVEPKLQAMFSSSVEPLRWPMTVTGIPWKRAMPPRMALSSRH